MRFRFHRNKGAHGKSQWMIVHPAHPWAPIHAYASEVIARDVEFHVAGLDGWAVGELVWCRGVVSPVPGLPLLPEVEAASRADLVLDGGSWPWPQLWFCTLGEVATFQLEGRLVVFAAEMLLSPDGSARARPLPAPPPRA